MIPLSLLDMLPPEEREELLEILKVIREKEDE